MHYDVTTFLDQLSPSNDIETRAYLPTLKSDLISLLSKFKGDSTMSHAQVGGRILSGGYGSVLSLKFKRWIFGNYPIGNAAGDYDSFTDTTRMLPA